MKPRSPPANERPEDGFRVARWMDVLGALVCDRFRFAKALARIESRLVADELAEIAIDRPIWVAGLARSGSTVLLELLARHAAVATHRYRDFPPVLTPVLWNRLLSLMPLRGEQPKERAHRDGIAVTADSPEAFEEVVWMAFFDHLHDDDRSAVLDAGTMAPAFEGFLRDHIRKMLLVRSRPRYLAKANYNITRLAYLLKLFPDVRFVIPIRDPVWHVASLMKQHELFRVGQAAHPAARRHLARAGHFEFGADRRVIHCGDAAAVREMAELRTRGREAEAWARQWALVYGLVADQLAHDPALRAAALVVRYEDLCDQPRETMALALDHCRLEPQAAILARAAGRLRRPSYYAPRFDPAERAAIDRQVDTVAARFGYGRDGGATTSGGMAAGSVREPDGEPLPLRLRRAT